MYKCDDGHWYLPKDMPDASLVHFDAAEARLRFETLEYHAESEVEADDDFELNTVDEQSAEDAGSLQARQAVDAVEQAFGKDWAQARSVASSVLEPLPEEADMDVFQCYDSYEHEQAYAERVAIGYARAVTEASVSQSISCKVAVQEAPAVLVHEPPEDSNVCCVMPHSQANAHAMPSDSDVAQEQV